MSPIERAHARVGHAVRGKWRLESLLSAGATSAVYAATHRNRNRGAVKMLHAELSARPQSKGSFLRAGYAANGIPHDGVARVLDDDVAEDGSAFLVMELLEGQTLKERIDRACGPLAMEEALSIVEKVLDILAAAHAHGIQHRDITPKNVFLTNDAKVKIIDFGSAFVADLNQQSGETLSGTPTGTPAFMAPELARGRMAEVDPRSDVYAVGAVLFMMLTGVAPRRADTQNEELLAAMTQPLLSIAERRPELPSAVVDLVDRALAFEKTDRWPGARAMQDALRRARERMASVPEVVAEIVGPSAGPDSWNAGPTQQAVSPYMAEIAPPPPNPAMDTAVDPMPPMPMELSGAGMNPLFVRADASHPPVARSAPPPYSYAPPRKTNVIPLVALGVSVLGLLVAGVFFLADAGVLRSHRAAKPALAAAPIAPPRDTNEIPPPEPAAAPLPAPAPDKVDPPADKPLAAAPSYTPQPATPLPPPPPTPPRSSSRSSRRTAPSSTAASPSKDPLVRVNPFDSRD